MRGRKLRTNILKFSFSNRCASAAMVSKTSDDLPEPDIPVKMIILRLGIFKVTSLRLFSRAPRISIYSCIITPYTATRFSGSLVHGNIAPAKGLTPGSLRLCCFSYFIMDFSKEDRRPQGAIPVTEEACAMRKGGRTPTRGNTGHIRRRHD